MTQTFTLPTELASGFINNDWSILDYINDNEYTRCVADFISDNRGLDCIDVDDDSSFVKYHDMSNYGVLACECSTYTFK